MTNKYQIGDHLKINDKWYVHEQTRTGVSNFELVVRNSLDELLTFKINEVQDHQEREHPPLSEICAVYLKGLLGEGNTRMMSGTGYLDSSAKIRKTGWVHCLEDLSKYVDEVIAIISVLKDQGMIVDFYETFVENSSKVVFQIELRGIDNDE